MLSNLACNFNLRRYNVAPDMRSQAVANTVWGFATLNWELGGATWDALEAAVVRVAPGMNAQEVWLHTRDTISLQ